MVTADGEWGNWTFSETLNPDVEVLDFWHAIEKLHVAADAAFGSDEMASKKWELHIQLTILLTVSLRFRTF